MSGYNFAVRHGHDWEEHPVMDSNPPWYTRTCKICGLGQQRWGATIVTNGPSIPGTDWQDIVPDDAS